MKYLSLILVFILSILSDLDAQVDRRVYYSYGEKIFSEVLTFPSASEDSIKAVFVCKIVNSFLPFSVENNQFIANPKMEIICRDDDGIIRKRFEVSANSIVSNYDETVSKKNYTMLMGETNLKNSNYEISIKINNSNSANEIEHKLKIKKSESISKVTLYNPIYAKLSDINFTDEIEPYILENKVAFSSSGARILIPMTSSNISQDNFVYSIKSKQLSEDETEENENFVWAMNVNLSDKIKIRANSKAEFYTKQNNQKLFIDLKTLPESNYSIMDIELPSDRFVPGKYILKIENKSIGFSQDFEFEVIWENPPISLKNIDYAIDMTYYILTEKEYENMQLGSKSERRKSFLDYWKKLDPTPLTPFNEALAQYFDRVDYAFFNYQTIVEKDGAKSDRGKIYILNGKADSIESSFNNEKAVEKWIYSRLNKEYTFEMVRPSVYKLIKING